jgi:alcohol dehydrogenase
LQPLPLGWSFAEGAAFPVQALTAWYALVELGSARPGQVVLLHSAAGGVGLLALAIMLKLGVQPIAIVGSESKAVFLHESLGLPLNRIIVRNPRTFPNQLDAALKNAQASGFDLILDSLAGRYFKAGYKRLNPRGRLIIYGAATMMPSGKSPNRLRLAWQYWQRPKLDPLAMISRNRSVMGFNLIWLWEQQELFREMIERIMELKLAAPYIGGRFPFEKAPEAQCFLQSGTSIGKVILEV